MNGSSHASHLLMWSDLLLVYIGKSGSAARAYMSMCISRIIVTKPSRGLNFSWERDILCYKHVCFAKLLASIPKKLTNTDCRSLHLQWKSQLVRPRIFDSNERSILSKSLIKQGSSGWHGVSAHQTYIRTCDLEVPRGHATVKCGMCSGKRLDMYARANEPGKYGEGAVLSVMSLLEAHTRQSSPSCYWHR